MPDQGIILTVPTPLVPRRVLGNPFGTCASSWCPRCRMEVDGHHEITNRAGRYLFRTTCDRCGRVLAFGGYEVPTLAGPSRVAAMREWCVTPTRDRR